jgi:endo-1,4-beta-xylanase
MKVRGHVLVWHSQAPAWFRTGTFTRAEAQQVMDDHITAVVGRYRGRIVAWDVVNEGFDDAAQFRTAQPVWERLGREYVARAFRTARAADPQAQLFYNDYNIEGPSRKADSTFALVRDLRAAGAPIDGIGMQAHFVVGGVPSKDQMLQNFARFAALGLKIHITELDVRVPTPASAADLERQAQHYRDVVDVCVQTPACEMIVTWGVSDLDSWVPGTFPGFGDALLFDRAFQAKPAYTAVRNFLNGQ